MAQEQIRYPVDSRSFPTIRNGNFVYVDKTRYVYKMTHSTMKYVFLSRPRRFGKSMLVSTLKSYFKAERDLFKNLAIEKLETEWRKYPVIHLDMTRGKGKDRDALRRFLIGQLEDCEEEYGLSAYDSTEPEDRFSKLIKRLYREKGEQVVVLVDEYDSPMLEVTHDEEKFVVVRNVMKYFYETLKECEDYIRFVFITGITKFSQASIFSALNNIKNISMLEDYAAVCGITEEEMLSQMSDGIDRIAAKIHVTREEAVRRIKAMYDGYHFTWPSPGIYNPFSLVNAFADGELNSYWFGSGTPTYLVEALRRYKVEPNEIGGMRAKATEFDAPTEKMNNIVPLLYQSGYVTITDYDPDSELYTLDIPNREVRSGLMDSLVPFYVSGDMVDKAKAFGAEFYAAVRRGDVDRAMQLLRGYLLTLPYTDNSDSEGLHQTDDSPLMHFTDNPLNPPCEGDLVGLQPPDLQKLLYVLFDIGGKDIEPEVELHTADGRIDLTVKTKDVIYIMELKMNRSAEEALRQIDKKNYAAKFRFDERRIIKVGVNFSSKTHTIDGWKIE